jgi:beta-glucanase (GH16 family)
MNLQTRVFAQRILMLGLLGLACPTFGVKAQQDWKLVWSDEFNGSKGSSVDSKIWKYDIGGGGWGNNELEFYTNKTQNVYQDGTGNLVIKAIKETLKDGCWYGDCDYTSGRILTKGTLERQYGRFEARMRIPTDRGMWAAFWMLGANIGTVNWPSSGEIDIMENNGREPKTVRGTIHGPGYSGGKGVGAPYSSEKSFSDGFHVFAVEWEPEVIRWYVDGNLFQTRTPKDLPEGAKWVFDHKFFMILNLAVGGNYPGDPDAKTKFPQSMKVDYVRVYER